MDPELFYHLGDLEASPSSTLCPWSSQGSPRRPIVIKVADAKLQTPAWMIESLVEEYLGKAPSKALPPWMVRKLEIAACRSRARARQHQTDQQEDRRRSEHHGGRRPDPRHRRHREDERPLHQNQPHSGSRQSGSINS